MQKIVFIFLILFVSLIRAQTTFTISGNVTDSDDKPITVGEVFLFIPETNKLVDFTILNDEGFSFEEVQTGTYLLQISSVDFKTHDQVLVLDKNLRLSVKLDQEITNLDEVEVVATKPILTNKNGNLTIDVQNPIFAAIPEPVELLSKLPGIQVSPDRETITVIGRGTPLIYLNNQRITIEEFNTLSVADIETIEIIRNPSAKYEANGRSVLLITRVVNTTEGLKVGLSETLSFKQNTNNYLSSNGSFKKKRLTIKANVALNNLETWESNTFEFAIPEQDVLTDYLVLIDKNIRTQINTGGGFFYQINDTDYFSWNTSLRIQRDDFQINTDTFLKQETQEDIIVTSTENNNGKNFFSSAINYNKLLGNNLNLFTGIQYSSFSQFLNTDIDNNVNDEGFKLSQVREQEYRIGVLAYRLDMEKNFDNGLKFEMGVNLSQAKANSETAIDIFEPEDEIDINFDYQESTYATYAQLSGNIGDKINFNTGFRLERNEIDGESTEGELPLVSRKNTILFPRTRLGFELDSIQTLTLNYAKSINRPSFSNASSITSFINPFLEGSNNVNLRPTVSSEASITFQRKNNSLSFEYTETKFPIYYTIDYEAMASRAVLSPRNLDKRFNYALNLTIPITKGKWTASNFLSLAYTEIEDKTAELLTAKPYVYFYSDHQFKLGKQTTVSFGGWAITRRNEGIFERNQMVVLNAGFTRTFFKKLDFALRWNDITKAMNFEERYNINGVNANGVYFADARELAFTLRYSFGKIKEPDYKNKDVDENLDRIR